MNNKKYEKKIIFNRFFKNMFDDDIYGFDIADLLSYESITKDDMLDLIEIITKEAYKEIKRYINNSREENIYYCVSGMVRIPSNFLGCTIELLTLYNAVNTETLKEVFLNYGKIEKYLEKVNKKMLEKCGSYVLKQYIISIDSRSVPLSDPEYDYDTERVLCCLKRYLLLKENQEFIENLIKENLDLFTYGLTEIKGCFLTEIQKYVKFSDEFFKDNIDRFFVYYLQTFLTRYKNNKEIVTEIFEHLIPHSLKRIAKILSGNDLYQLPKCEDRSDLVLKYYIA